MSAINETLLPALLFVVYFFLAIQFLPQLPTAMFSDLPKVIGHQANPVIAIETEEVIEACTSSQDNRSQSSIVILQQRDYTNDLADALISRDWLKTQSLVNLKAIAAELCINPIGDKRAKSTWIDAIASTTSENTVLAVNLCYA